MNSHSSSLRVAAHLRRIAVLLPALAIVVIARQPWRMSVAHEQRLADTLSEAGQRPAQLPAERMSVLMDRLGE